MNVKMIRRQNLRALARSVGGVTSLAERLGKSQSQISHVIGTHPTKNIGDKLAATIEKAFDKPVGWLDQKHLDDPTTALFYPASPTHQWVPLLPWNQISAWTNRQLQETKNTFPQIVITGNLSSYAFAVLVNDNCMQSSYGTSFIPGNCLIVDPEAVLKDGCFVIVSMETMVTPVFRQLVRDGATRYLKPLNPYYPLSALKEPYTIHGIVRYMLHVLPP